MRIAARPAAEPVEEVRKELIQRNPDFDGTMRHKIEDDVVTEIRIVTDRVTDVAPIRVFNPLRVLELGGTEGEQGATDLAPLTGMNLSRLTRLSQNNTKVDDAGLVHFQDFKDLTSLRLNRTRVSNAGLACFKDCKSLVDLDLGGLPVNDRRLANFKVRRGLTGL